MAFDRTRKLIALLLCFLLSSSVFTVAALPTTLSSIDDHKLAKREPNPPFPTVQELQGHLKKPGSGKSLFYSGGMLWAASAYAREKGLTLMGDTDDGSGWAMFDSKVIEERSLRVLDDLPTWTDDELIMVEGLVCEAYAENAEGETIVVLPYDFDTTTKTYWNMNELDALIRNPNVPKILAFDIKNKLSTPKGDPRELWPNPAPKTEHAG